VLHTKSVREEVLLALNSHWFHFGGAVRKGNFKLIYQFSETQHSVIVSVLDTIQSSNRSFTASETARLISEAYSSSSPHVRGGHVAL
jgi:hypothetical protein